MSQNFLKPGSLTLPKFVKRLGYRTAHDREFNVLLKMLLQRSIVEIQQSGFRGHSLAHDKLVVIREPLKLENVERINASLRVNFNIGPFTVHKATKPFKCDACHADIWPGERYGSRVRLGRRRSRKGRPPILKYTVLCLPCLIGRYDEFLI